MAGCDGCNQGDPCKAFLGRDGGLNLRDAEESSDTYFARELESLTAKELNKVYEEIHGVAEEMDENPDFVIEKLQALEAELLKIKHKPQYDRALFLSPRYVKDDAFRIKFLRAERFEPDKAATRLVTYFQNKNELFGEEKLVKKLTLDDLEPEDVEEIMTGSFHYAPNKDSRGRTICLVIQKLFEYKSWQSKIRAIWYTMMCALEDEEAQKKGIVNVYYNVDLEAPEPLYFELIRHVKMLDDSIPYRTISLHYCYNNAAIRPALELFQLIAGKKNRIRFRTHFGSHMECQFTLMTFGITREILQLDENGNLKPGVMQPFLEKRQALEASSEQDSDQIDFPRKFDVLLGRGRPYQDYSGNLALTHLLNARTEEYKNASRFEKTVISYDIVKSIHDRGGRFLQRDESTGGWQKVSETMAREKVSNRLRIRIRAQADQPSMKN